MAKRLDEILAELSTTRVGPEGEERVEQLMDDLRALKNKKDAIEPLLHFIEQHPHDDLGAPGPVVHFLEEFHKKGYEPLLIESVRRAPTTHNVWMLNRLINGSHGRQQQAYLDVLREVARDSATPGELRDLAEEFLLERRG